MSTRRSRIRRDFHPGQVIYYWRKARSTSEPGRYRGPARVICQEGKSIVWITNGRVLIRAAPEQLRVGDQLDEEMVNLEEASRQVDLSAVLEGVRHGGVEDISGDGAEPWIEEDPDDDFVPPGSSEEGEDEEEERNMKLRIPPSHRPSLPMPVAGPPRELGDPKDRAAASSSLPPGPEQQRDRSRSPLFPEGQEVVEAPSTRTFRTHSREGGPRPRPCLTLRAPRPNPLRRAYPADPVA